MVPSSAVHPNKQRARIQSKSSVLIASPPEDVSSDTVQSVYQNVCSQLSNVQTDFVKINKSTNAIAIGFPDASTRTDAAQILDGNFTSQGYSLREAKKMLPKLTIENVHMNDVFHGLKADSQEDLRDLFRQKLKPSILSKNKGIQKLHAQGHTLDVVYMSRFTEHDRYFSFALKVSPAIRLNALWKIKVGLYGSEIHVTQFLIVYT